MDDEVQTTYLEVHKNILENNRKLSLIEQLYFCVEFPIAQNKN